MALVVEDGTGRVNADAYVDADYVSAYATKFGLTWSPGTVGAGEIAIRKGTQFIDGVYEPRMRGMRTFQVQALAYPRIDVETDDGFYIASNTIPEELKEATAEASVKALAGEDLIPDLADSGTISSKDVTVGPIRKAVEYVGGSSPIKWYRKIDLILARLLFSGSVLRRA